MGAGFVIFIWLILAGVYGSIFLAFAGIWFWGRKKNITWLKWIGKIPAIAMAGVALLTVAFLVWGFVRSMNPSWVFKETFNTVPPSSVSKIQSSFYSFADTGDVYLRFQISNQEFEKLVSTNLVKKTAEEMKRDTPGESGGNVPKWWDYQIQSDWIYFLRVSPPGNNSEKKGFASETEYFASIRKRKLHIIILSELIDPCFTRVRSVA